MRVAGVILICFMEDVAANPSMMLGRACSKLAGMLSEIFLVRQNRLIAIRETQIKSNRKH